MSKHSNAARRATEAIFKLGMFFADDVASIIDKETGLPDLVAAAGRVLDESTGKDGVSAEAWNDLQVAWQTAKGVKS